MPIVCKKEVQARANVCKAEGEDLFESADAHICAAAPRVVRLRPRRVGWQEARFLEGAEEVLALRVIARALLGRALSDANRGIKSLGGA